MLREGLRVLIQAMSATLTGCMGRKQRGTKQKIVVEEGEGGVRKGECVCGCGLRTMARVHRMVGHDRPSN